MNNIDQIITLLKAQQQSGQNLDQIIAGLEATAANRQTSLGLNQWAASDKPSMEDFNRDNETIDREIVALHDEKANKAAVYSKMEIDSKLNKKLDLTSSEPLIWTTVPLTTSYTSSEGIWNFKYAKDKFNIMYLEGSFKKNSVLNGGDNIFTLPPGYRPKIYATVFITGQTSGLSTALHIYPDGKAVIGGILPTGLVASENLYINSTFKAEQ